MEKSKQAFSEVCSLVFVVITHAGIS